VGEPVNGVGNTDTPCQEASPTEFSAFKAGYSSCEEQNQSPFETANIPDRDEQHQAQPSLCTTDTLSQADLLAQAARLLVEIAGPEPVHIEMSSRGPMKYCDVKGAITERDTRLHLGGWKTKGAYLLHPGGMTRALCYDADTPHDWQTLQTAARFLTYGDFCPILEPSPVQDGQHSGGGHLWIIFTDLVKATWAQQRALQYAPMLKAIKESWPSPGNHKVRLPGGKYVKPGFAAWCHLYDAYGKLLATDGQGAARTLLDAQTPVDIIPEYPEPDNVAQHGVVQRPDTPPQACTRAAKNVTKSCDGMQPGVDQHWQEKYGRSLWFQFTPAQLAAWYNTRHEIQEMLPPEKNGMGLASWRGERTASVGYTRDGIGWVDFGASAERLDGKRDGGDALELETRITQETKPEVMRQAARALVSEARHAMENAARNGKLPPAWVQAFMSPAGWERYEQLCHEHGHQGQRPSDTSTLSVTIQTQDYEARAANEHAEGAGGVAGSCAQSPAHDTPEALAVEIGAEIGEPCTQCGCTLCYQSGPYVMCYRCYPRRLTDDQRDRLHRLFPPKRSLEQSWGTLNRFKRPCRQQVL
jgi:hypothetical protein